MTATRNDIVTLALQELKQSDLVDLAEAEDIALANAALVALLAEGRSIGRSFVWWASANDDAIPDEAKEYLATALAGKIAHKFYESSASEYEARGLEAQSMLQIISPTPLILRRDSIRV